MTDREHALREALLKQSERKRQIREYAKHPGRSWRVSGERGAWGKHFDVENKGDFDEFVVDHWLHIEKMDTRKWWMRLGDREFDIEIGKDGKVSVRDRED